MRRPFVLVLAVCLMAAGDKPQKLQLLKRGAEFVFVPVGAIKIPLRDVQQPDDFSCGPACLMAIASYYGVGPESLATFVGHVHADPQEGTYYKDLVRYAEGLTLQAEIVPDMGPEKLKTALDSGKPVICSIQAWADNGKPRDYAKDGEGHYVVAIGYDAEHWYFMDPSANYEGSAANPRYGCLTHAEFTRRWHDDEGMHGAHEKIRQLGIVICCHGDPRLRARVIE